MDLKLEKIKGGDTLLKIFCTLIIIVIICISIGHYAFKNGVLTCDHYIFNTYLYIILAILLMFLIVFLNDQFGFANGILNWMFSRGSGINSILVFVVLLGLMLGLTYALHAVNPQNIAASNGIWLALVTLFGLLLIPSIYIGRMTDSVGIAGIITILIIVSTGLLGYYYGDVIVRFDWDYYLHIALFIMIVITFLGWFFIKTNEDAINFIYVTSVIFLVLFVLLLLSNHKRLKENAEKCKDGVMIPNYPVESWELVIKIYIIFKEIINIIFARRLRR